MGFDEMLGRTMTKQERQRGGNYRPIVDLDPLHSTFNIVTTTTSENYRIR
jgi:hypothetical protein